MQDNKILAACIASRKAYDAIAEHVNVKEFSPHVGFWWQQLEMYYDRDRAAKLADLEVLRSIGEQRISNPKHRDSILAALSSDTVSATNVVSAVLELKRYNAAMEFAAATSAHDDKKARKLLAQLDDLYARDSLSESRIEYVESFEGAIGSTDSGHRIPLSPDGLNARCGGGALPGHHILVFGRTNVGKSCFVINLAATLVRKGKRVLYVGNEDTKEVIYRRLVGRLCRLTSAEIDADPKAAEKLFAKRGGMDLLKVGHAADTDNLDSIGEAVEEHRAQVVIVDQIRNVAGPEDGMTTRLEGNAIRFRSLVSHNRLLGVSVTQASNRDQRHNEDGPLWLDAGSVDSSRVGLPGQVDLMLGIGCNSDLRSRGQRAISLCKNKLAAGPNSEEGFICQFDLERSVVTSA